MLVNFNHHNTITIDTIYKRFYESRISVLIILVFLSLSLNICQKDCNKSFMNDSVVRAIIHLYLHSVIFIERQYPRPVALLCQTLGRASNPGKRKTGFSSSGRTQNCFFFATKPLVGFSLSQTRFWLFFACNFQAGFSSYRATIYTRILVQMM